jgi:hypothetical protein
MWIHGGSALHAGNARETYEAVPIFWPKGLFNRIGHLPVVGSLWRSMF